MLIKTIFMIQWIVIRKKRTLNEVLELKLKF